MTKEKLLSSTQALKKKEKKKRKEKKAEEETNWSGAYLLFGEVQSFLLTT